MTRRAGMRQRSYRWYATDGPGTCGVPATTGCAIQSCVIFVDREGPVWRCMGAREQRVQGAGRGEGCGSADRGTLTGDQMVGSAPSCFRF
eukprot:1176475-Prorocentrum_minimum.AAC.4